MDEGKSADYVKQKCEFINEIKKRAFRALLQLADSQEIRLEMLDISEVVKAKMLSMQYHTRSKTILLYCYTSTCKPCDM